MVKVIIDGAELQISKKEWKKFLEWRMEQYDIRRDVEQIFKAHKKDLNRIRPGDPSESLVLAAKETLRKYGHLGTYNLARIMGVEPKFLYRKLKRKL